MPSAPVEGKQRFMHVPDTELNQECLAKQLKGELMLETKWSEQGLWKGESQVSVHVLPFSVHALENVLASLSLNFLLCEVGNDKGAFLLKFLEIIPIKHLACLHVLFLPSP
jgi:hypothetical protein